MRHFFSFFLFLILVLSFAEAARVDGWRGSHLDSRTSGFSLTAPEYVSDVDVRVNGQSVDVTDWDELLVYRDGAYKFAPKVRVQRTVLNSGNIKNATMSFVFNKPYEEVGSGILQFTHNYSCWNEFGTRTTCYYYDYWTFADLFNATNWHRLQVNLSKSAKTYNVTLWGFNSSVRMHRETGGRGWIELDPQATFENTTVFANGLYNKTYNNASQSLYSLYFPNNNSFANNTEYLSQIVVVNTSGQSIFTTVNWSWHEVMSFGNGTYAVVPQNPLSYNFLNRSNQSGEDGYVAYDSSSEIWTRYPTQSTAKIGNCGGCIGESNFRSYLQFNLSSLPANAAIVNATLSIFMGATPATSLLCGIRHLDAFSFNYANTSGGNSDFFTDMNNGTTYNYSNWCNSTGLKNVTLDSSVYADMLARAGGVWGVGINSSETNTGFTPNSFVTGENSTAAWRPYLRVFFTTGNDLTETGYDQPLFHLDFEGGDFKDRSKRNNSFSSNGTAASLPTFKSVGCPVGDCLSFDFNDELRMVRNNNNNLSQAVTVAFWINFRSNSTTNQYILSRLGFSTFQGIGVYANAWNNTHLWWHMPLGNGTTIPDNGQSNASCFAVPNQTYHIAMTWNASSIANGGGNWTLYINGTQCGSPMKSISNDIENLQDYWQINKRFTENGNLNLLDEVMVYNRSLTALEINKLFNWQNSASVNRGFVTNFTNVSIQVRSKNYTWNNSNLLLWYDLGDSSENETSYGKILDASGQGGYANFSTDSQVMLGYVKNLPLVNTTTAVIGKALQLGRHGSIIAYAPTTLDINSPYTYGFWYRPVDMDSVIGAVLMANIDGVGGSSGTYSQWNRGYISCVNTDGALSQTVNSSRRFGNNDWLYIVCAMNGTHQLLYVNGTLVNATTFFSGGDVSPSNLWGIGRLTISGSALLNGTVDDAKAWQRALNATEITNLYNGGNPTVNGQEFNWTVFTPKYYSGYAVFPTVYSNLLQYKLDLYAVNETYTPFVRRVVFNYTSVRTDQTAPQWSNNRTTSTTAGFPSTFLVDWTDDTNLNNYTYEIDNGNGFQNYSSTYFNGLTNTSNRTITLNGTVGQLIRWRVYAWDLTGKSNATNIFEFTTTNPPINNYCNLYGGYLANQSGEYITYAANASLTCTFTLKNATGYAFYNFTTMTNLSRGFYNVSLNLSRAGLYNATVNCSNGTETNPLFYENKQVQVRNSCAADPTTDSLLICMVIENSQKQAFLNSEKVIVYMSPYLLAVALLVAILLFVYWVFSNTAKRTELIMVQSKNTALQKQIDFYNGIALLSLFFALGTVFIFVFLSGFATEQVNVTTTLNYTNTSISGTNYPIVSNATTASVSQPTAATSSVMWGLGLFMGLYLFLLIGWMILHFIGSAISEWGKNA